MIFSVSLFLFFVEVLLLVMCLKSMNNIFVIFLYYLLATGENINSPTKCFSPYLLSFFVELLEFERSISVLNRQRCSLFKIATLLSYSIIFAFQKTKELYYSFFEKYALFFSTGDLVRIIDFYSYLNFNIYKYQLIKRRLHVSLSISDSFKHTVIFFQVTYFPIRLMFYLYISKNIEAFVFIFIFELLQ